MADLLAELPEIPRDRTVLIAGPTASGKSALALAIAQKFGGGIVNADASQVYACWRVVTARPDVHDEGLVAHHLYGHVAFDAAYSAGHWLRDVAGVLQGERAIIVGGTGLYFQALTRGLTDIPAIPADIRARGDAMQAAAMVQALDPRSAGRVDLKNRARVQRAWEVLNATGRGLAEWQDDTGPPLLPLENAVPLLLETPKAWLEARIARRFDAMLELGALAEVATMRARYDPSLPAFRAIGVPELMAHLAGELTLDEARRNVTIHTRRFAKRQRTWFRSKMAHWHKVDPSRY